MTRGWWGERVRHSIAARKRRHKFLVNYKKKKYPHWMKHITHKQFIYWDFDKDGMPNIDDTKPFDEKQKEPIDRHSMYSRELREIEKIRQQHLPHTKKLHNKLKKEFPEKQGYFASVRRKSSPSILNKLVRQIGKIGDITGGIVVSENKQLYHKAKQKIKGLGYKFPKGGIEDHYKRKRIPHYKATHFDIKITEDIKGEIQAKTERQRRLQKILHEHYKKGKPYGLYTKAQAIREANKRDYLDRQSRLKIRKKDFWAKI